MRVFLDANILFSAADPVSATRRLLNTLFNHASVVANRHVWEEAERNIELKRPALLHELGELEERLEFVSQFSKAGPVTIPEKDQPVIRGAVGSKCTHLWTSDLRHFGNFYGKEVHGTKIVSSIMLADELSDQGWL